MASIIKALQDRFEHFGYRVEKTEAKRAGLKNLVFQSRGFSETQLNKISQEIFEFFQEIDPLYSNIQSGPLAIAGAWKNDLLTRRKDQIDAITSRNVAAYTGLLKNFFRNQMISGLWNHTYFPADHSAKIPHGLLGELDFATSISGRKVSEIVQKSSFGNPWGLQVDQSLVKMTDPWHLLQADSVFKMIEFLYGSRSQKIPTIVDLGSGFGGTARNIAAWLNGNLNLILVDIPLNLVNAYAYLKAELPEIQIDLIKNRNDLQRMLSKESSTSGITLLPNIYVDDIKSIEIDVLLNAGSLSEMDLITIEYYLTRLCGNQTKCFIEFNSNTSKENTSGHREIISSKFPVPAPLFLFSRSMTFSGNRYLKSIYLNRNLITVSQ